MRLTDAEFVKLPECLHCLLGSEVRSWVRVRSRDVLPSWAGWAAELTEAMVLIGPCLLQYVSMRWAMGPEQIARSTLCPEVWRTGASISTAESIGRGRRSVFPKINVTLADPVGERGVTAIYHPAT
jgi:hypothetical protein